MSPNMVAGGGRKGNMIVGWGGGGKGGGRGVRQLTKEFGVQSIIFRMTQ